MSAIGLTLPRRGGTAFRRLFFFLLLPLLLTPTPGLSDPLLDKLDAYYYYPQREGLKKLAFTIHWAQLDPFSGGDDKKLLNNPTVRFNWQAGMVAPHFEMEATEKDVPAERELQILQFMNQYAEIFIPVPLSQKLSGYSLNAQRRGKDSLEVRYTADHPQPVMQYDFKIDSGRRVIDTLYMKMKSGPQSVTSHFIYTQRGTKWQVVESRARYEMGGHQYEEILEFFYEKVEGFWLPSRIRQQLKEGSRLAQSNVFTLSRYQVN